jgi:SAM-dependent methyltransferase
LEVEHPHKDQVFARFHSVYSVDANPDQAWPELQLPGGLQGRLGLTRSRLRRRLRGRRLAYLDSTFPWERSGFRYHEALALHELRPDTLFFSMWELNDPFPAPVHPLSEFPLRALHGGVTDVYAVFSLFLESLTGMRPQGSVLPDPMEGLDISDFCREAGIRTHGTIFPGGGLTVTPSGLENARELARRLDNTFSYVQEVLEHVPEVTYVQQALTETRFYPQTEERWEQPQPLTCLFAADPSTRKGLDVALAAFAELDPKRFHLHLVGPHEHRREEFPAELMTFHGWLSPTELRDLHRQVHVFLSPVSAEPPGTPGSFQGVTDGFPTQAAADAMSSGALLVSANPADDHRVLTPEQHYLERPATAEAFRATLLELAADPGWTRRVAEAGSNQVREQMDVRRGIAIKLEAIDSTPARAPEPASARSAARGKSSPSQLPDPPRDPATASTEAAPSPPVYFPVRREFAHRYISGSGLEIGALNRPLDVPDDARVSQVDRMSVADLRRHYPEMEQLELPEVDVVDNGETLATVAGGSQDFIIANHFLEHTADPIRTIGNHLSKLKPGGVLFYAVPDKRYSFDFRRPITPLEHMVRDHEEGAAGSRAQHYEEWARFVASTDEERATEGFEELARQRARELDAADYSIHTHTWDQASFLELILHCRERFDEAVEIEAVAQHSLELVVVLRKSGAWPAATEPTANTADMRRQVRDLEARVQELDRELRAVKDSPSWRATKPLRALKARLGKR